MARNKNAGEHPSYDKRNMSKKAHDNKKAYDKKLNAKPEQVKKRVEANRARRKAIASGKNVDGKDASHTINGIVFKPTHVNRGSKTDTKGDRARQKGIKKKCSS